MIFGPFYQPFSIVSIGVYAFLPPHFVAPFVLTHCKISTLRFVARDKQ